MRNPIVCFFIHLSFFSFGQVEELLRDTSFIKEHKIRSVTAYYNHLDEKIKKGISKPDMNKGFSKNRYWEFDRKGKMIKNIDYQEEYDHIYNGRFFKDSIQNIVNGKGQIIEQRFYTYGNYQYSELFEYDSQGKVTITRTRSNSGEVCLKDSSLYDARGNHILMLYGNCYSEDDRWKYKHRYNANNQKISTLSINGKNNSVQLDSILYDSAGRYLGNYKFDFHNNKPTLTYKFLITYDEKGNKLSEKSYEGKGLNLTSSTRFVYNSKNQLIEKAQGNSRSKFTYNGLGNLTEVKFFSNDVHYTILTKMAVLSN